MDDYTDKELADGPYPIEPPRYNGENPSDEFPNENDNWNYFCEVFEFAIIEMSEIYARHRKEKGDSWKNMRPADLRLLFDHELEKYFAANSGSLQEMNELKDLLNIGFMLYTRLHEKMQARGDSK